MARSEARLQFGIWQGLRAVSRDAKLLYQVLLTEPTVNHAGVGALRIELWANKSGMSVEEVGRALVELGREPQVVVDYDTQEVLIRTLLRNDGVAEQPYVLKGALKEALQTVSPLLRRVLAAELRKLPPKRPDGLSKSGRPVTHADPHAIADELDRPVPPASEPQAPEILSEPPQNPVESLSEPSRNPIETVPEPSVREGAGKGFETLRGGGRGGGKGFSPVVTAVGINDDDARAREPSSSPPSLLQLASQAVAATIGASRPRAVRQALVRRAVMLLEEGGAPEDLSAALAEWRVTPEARVSWLDHKLSDVISRREARPALRPGRSTTDERARLYEEALAHGCATPAEQFAYAAAARRGPAPGRAEEALAAVITLPRSGS